MALVTRGEILDVFDLVGSSTDAKETTTIVITMLVRPTTVMTGTMNQS